MPQTIQAFQSLVAVLSAHSGILSLLGLAIISAMPDTLPITFWPPRVPLEWGWQWLHGTLKTFANFRMPNRPAENRPPDTPK